MANRDNPRLGAEFERAIQELFAKRGVALISNFEVRVGAASWVWDGGRKPSRCCAAVIRRCSRASAKTPGRPVRPRSGSTPTSLRDSWPSSFRM